MIEILITLVIIVVGLLGVMEMQTRLQRSEMEAYQRTQAMFLLNDMAQRLNTNRAYTEEYVTGTGSPLGTTFDCSSIGSTELYEKDKTEWCEALQGASETQNGGSVGTIIGGRGCVESLVAGSEYRVTVAWQGLTPISRPPTSILCGVDTYNDSLNGADCADNMCRRYVATVVRIAELDL